MKQYILLLSFTFFCALQGSNPTAFDTSFNGTGYVEQSLGTTQSAGQNSVLMQDDGKIISIGVTSDTALQSILLARYLSDGTVDVSYGTSGITTQDFGYRTYAYAATMQADGKVVVVGLLASTQTQFFVARFTTDGLLDSYSNNTTDPFGNATPASALGYVTNYVPDTGYNAATDVAINPETGDIFVSGYANLSSNNYRVLFLYSYAVDGTLNTITFAPSNGYVTVSPPSGYLQTTGGVPAVQDDGKIVLSGNVCASTSLSGLNLQSALFRYNSDGSLDTTFGNGNGYVIFNEYSDYPYSNMSGIALQANGSIIISGHAVSASGDQQVMTARYLTDGTIDTSFNGIGYNVTTILNSISSKSQAVLIEASGKIIAGGYATFADSFNQILLVRYNLDGTLDTSLNSNGYMLSTINDLSTTLRSNDIQSDGKLVIVAQTTAIGDDQMITIRYLGGNILEGSTSEIEAYGSNANLFQEFLYINFYAQIITDTAAQAATVSAINSILSQYATDYADQPNFNYLLYLYLLEEQLTEAQAELITEYGDVGISEFFIYLNDRITQISNLS